MTRYIDNLIIEDGDLYFCGASEFGVNTKLFNYNSKYNQETKKWEYSDKLCLCGENSKEVYADTMNEHDRAKIKILKLMGAKVLYSRIGYDVYDKDPSGRSVPRWKADSYKFDVTEILNEFKGTLNKG